MKLLSLGGGGPEAVSSVVRHRYVMLWTFVPPHFVRAYRENYCTILFFVLCHHVICSCKNGNAEENASSTYNFWTTKSDLYLQKILLLKVNAHRHMIECEST